MDHWEGNDVFQPGDKVRFVSKERTSSRFGLNSSMICYHEMGTILTVEKYRETNREVIVFNENARSTSAYDPEDLVLAENEDERYLNNLLKGKAP